MIGKKKSFNCWKPINIFFWHIFAEGRFEILTLFILLYMNMFLGQVAILSRLYD